MRIFFVAGERSGDTHGANLVRALRRQVPEGETLACEGLGGELMAAEGMTLRYDLAGEAIMGFAEVLRHFPRIRRLFLDTLAYLRENPPDALVLIDYPGFNIRLAKAADALAVPIVYYISPQVWAWKKQRLHTLARYVDRMLVIFPFEEAVYAEAGMEAVYVGHPLLDHIAAYEPGSPLEGMVIGVLPGSRQQEIARLLGPMLATCRGIHEVHPEARFIAPCVSHARARQVEKLARAIAPELPLIVRVGGMYETLSHARFCLVASGTATLETALFGVPMVILYRVNPLTYRLARWLVDIESIGIVNILAGRAVVPEFIQGDARASRILPHALDLIADSPARRQMLTDLEAVRQQLGDGGASERAAAEILRHVRRVSAATTEDAPA